MKIRVKLPKPRNTAAAELFRRDGAYKPRVWKDKSKYTRKQKHKISMG